MGRWEAVREIIQNAYDQRDQDPDCVVTITHDPRARTLAIRTSTGQLRPESLLLGMSTKAADTSLRGQFGEGYKLAMLVLVRSAHDVVIANGPSIWIAQIEHNEMYNCNVLVVKTTRTFGVISQGVCFTISNIDTEEWHALSRNLGLEGTRILEDENQRGRIYVGGLYVTTIAELRYGYSFSPATLTLDRDRGMVSNFDVAFATSNLWAKQPGDKLFPLIEQEAMDVRYCEHLSDPTMSQSAYNSYISKYPDTIPVSSKEEIERAQAAGIKWTLVPGSLRSILRKIITFVIPSFKTPAERIRDLLAAHKHTMSDDVKMELQDIAERLEGFIDSGPKSTSRLEIEAPL